MNSENTETSAPQGKERMKQGSGISASVGAILSSLATMGCCLPLGFAGALGAAGASAFVQKFRPWLLAISIVLLGIGFWQQRRAKLCSVKRNYLSAVLLWTAVVFVVAMIAFPRKLQDLSPIIFPEPRSDQETARRGRCPHRTASGSRISTHGFFDAEGARSSHHAHELEFRLVRNHLRQIHGRPSAGTSSFSNLINLSAGGLRSRTTIAAQCGPLAPSIGGLGAHACDGPAFTRS